MFWTAAGMDTYGCYSTFIALTQACGGGGPMICRFDAQAVGVRDAKNEG
jgi:hypothetical protein